MLAAPGVFDPALRQNHRDYPQQLSKPLALRELEVASLLFSSGGSYPAVCAAGIPAGRIGGVLVERQRFSSAALDARARGALSVVATLCVLVAGLMTYSGLDALGEEAGWIPFAALAVASFALATPFVLLSGLPTEYVLDGGTIRILRRWRPDRVFQHEGQAERFLDGASLKAKNLYGSGRPMFSSLVSATTDLPGGRLYFALTDRDRCVLIFTTDGSLLVSPSDPDSLVSAIISRR